MKPTVSLKQHPAPVLEVPLPGARVERGEQLVLDVDAGPGQRVHQRALAGVGVADQRDGVLLAAAAGPRAPCGPAPRPAGAFRSRMRPSTSRRSSSELRFAGAAHADAAAADPLRDRWVHICSQPGQRVFQLGQLDLQLGFDGAGAGGEDVEDQLAAVEHLELGRFFQVADLGGGQVVVEDDDVGVGWPWPVPAARCSLPLPM